MVEPQLTQQFEHRGRLAAARAPRDESVLCQVVERHRDGVVRTGDVADPDRRPGRNGRLDMTEVAAADLESRHRAVDRDRHSKGGCRVAGIGKHAQRRQIRGRRIRMAPDRRPPLQHGDIEGVEVPVRQTLLELATGATDLVRRRGAIALEMARLLPVAS